VPLGHMRFFLSVFLFIRHTSIRRSIFYLLKASLNNRKINKRLRGTCSTHGERWGTVPLVTLLQNKWNKGILGRDNCRLVDNIKTDLEYMRWSAWIKLIWFRVTEAGIL
jgi:hypothetical protein